VSKRLDRRPPGVHFRVDEKTGQLERRLGMPHVGEGNGTACTKVRSHIDRLTKRRLHLDVPDAAEVDLIAEIVEPLKALGDGDLDLAVHVGGRHEAVERPDHVLLQIGDPSNPRNLGGECRQRRLRALEGAPQGIDHLVRNRSSGDGLQPGEFFIKGCSCHAYQPIREIQTW
jgi:hypothetical protein